MCLTPKILHIAASGSFEKRLVALPCNKCNDCLNELRMQLVARLQNELKYCKSCFFVTLKYSNANLHYYNPSPDAKRKAIQRQMQITDERLRRWDRFLLRKDHAQKFVKNLQSCIHNYDSNYYARYYNIWEYGTVTHRPHGHALIFLPLKILAPDFQKIIQKCWTYGFIDVEQVPLEGLDSLPCINYLAHHQYKVEAGSSTQRKMAPIFHQQSIYNGGVGYRLAQEPEVLSNIRLGLNRIYIRGSSFTCSIPRQTKKILGLNQNLSESDFQEMAFQTLANLEEKFQQKNISLDFSENLTSDVYEKSKKFRILDAQKQDAYFKRLYHSKILTIVHKTKKRKNL